MQAPQPSSRSATGSTTWAPLGEPRFRRLTLAGASALSTFWMTEVACAWQMRELTDADPLRVALVGTSLQLTLMFALIPAGVLADALDRRKLLLLSSVGAASVLALIAALAALGRLGVTALFMLLPLVALAQALRMPVIGSLVADTVRRDDLPAAVSLNALAQNASRVLGPMLAGVLISTGGASVALGTAAIVLVLAGLALATVPSGASSHGAALSWSRLVTDARAEREFTARSAWKGNLLLRLAAFFLCTSSIPALLPVEFATGAVYGTMLACHGAGAVVSVLGLGRPASAQAMERRAQVAQLVHAMGLAVLGLSASLPLAAAALFVCGVCWLGVSNSLVTAAQLQLPAESRGRGLSVIYAVGMAGIAAGGPLWGAISRTWDTDVGFLSAAIVSITLLLLTRHRRFTVQD